jgi:hypothetical protein
MRRLISLASALVYGACSSASHAQMAQDQNFVTMNVSEISSQLDCTIYEESSGTDTTLTRSRTGVYSDPFFAVGIESTAQATYSTWETWYVKDCVDHFPSLKSSLQAALTDPNGPILVVRNKPEYHLTGALSATSTESGPSVKDEDTGLSISSNRMKLHFSFTVQDSKGRVVFASAVQSHINENSDVSLGQTSIKERADGEGLYTALEQRLAKEVARRIAFHFKPIKAQTFVKDRIELNYGANFLPVGSILTAISDRLNSVNLRVVAVNSQKAIAIVEGGIELSGKPEDWAISYAGPDGPETNRRRFQKVKLP